MNDPALQVWDVEGKITDYNRVNRTITANGMTFTLPTSLKVKTIDLDQSEGNLLFTDSDPTTADLTDPGLEAVRTIKGGTAIASGNTVFTDTASGKCMSLVATSVFIELAENGIIGPIMYVDPAGNYFVVNGVTVRMNTDPRFPKELLDLSGNPMPIKDLADYLGTLVDVGGYYDPVAGVLWGTAVEAEALRKQTGMDTVGIEKAQFSQGKLRVIGAISKNPVTGTFAPTVDVYAGTVNSAGTSCSGSKIGTASTEPGAPGLMGFDFRIGLKQAPDKVCVASPFGGIDVKEVIRS